MNKKIIVTFIIAILIIIVGIMAYIVFQNNREENKETSTNKQNSIEEQKNNKINESEKNNITNNSKIAVIYFSATGTTEKIAKHISEEINADLVKIEPKEPYTSADLNYNSDCRANKEQNDEKSRPEIKKK